MIQSFSLLEDLPPWKRLIGSLFFNPYYFRFDARLDVRINLPDCQDRLQGEAIYEVRLLR